MDSEEDIHLTPVILGLTKPPMMFGIPYTAFILLVGLTVIGFLLFNSIWAIVLAPFIYIALFTICSQDVMVLDILQVTASKTPNTPNKAFWGTNSYSP